MADTSTIASLATAGGTLVLAIATFFSTRSANQAARVAERSLEVGLRPVIFNARPQDPEQVVGFAEGHRLMLRDGRAAVEEFDGKMYLAIPLRNVGNGLGVLHGWHMTIGRPASEVPRPSVEDFRRLTRDLYVPAGDTGFWQTALRDSADALHAPLRQAIEARERILVDLLYSDHEGGQRTITRFGLLPPDLDEEPERDPTQWGCAVGRHWNLDRVDPR